MQFSQSIQAYIAYIKFQRGLSPNTVAGYQAWLRNFETWLKENGYPNPTVYDLTTPVLMRFCQSMCERQKCPRAVRSAFAPIQSLGTFLVEQGVLQNPATKVSTLVCKGEVERAYAVATLVRYFLEQENLTFLMF